VPADPEFIAGRERRLADLTPVDADGIPARGGHQYTIACQPDDGMARGNTAAEQLQSLVGRAADRQRVNIRFGIPDLGVAVRTRANFTDKHLHMVTST
jgi:hypothetical protein